MSVSMQVCLELRVELSRSIHSRCAASDMVVAVQKLCSFAWQGDAAVHRDGSHSCATIRVHVLSIRLPSSIAQTSGTTPVVPHSQLSSKLNSRTRRAALHIPT